MRENTLKRLWREDKPAFGAWLFLPDAFSAEVMARLGFDWVCIDMQHGLIDYQMALSMLQAISTTPAVPIVRVPWNDPAIIMKALDAGAYGVIIPLINDRAETEAAVAACRYPPLGIRSYGPIRAALYGGPGYAAAADGEICCIPMIETASALANLDEILTVPGVDAVYVGPMDLSLSIGIPPVLDGDAPEYVAARQRILAACRRHNVVAGINSTDETAAARAAEGFRFVLVSTDIGNLTQGAERQLAAVRAKLG
jgi:4-hydroxy-2-oxoheptanedioate aldolase